MFVNDYRPTKRVGIDELDGCIKLMGDAAKALKENGVAGFEKYEGAALALSLIRFGKFEYPHEFVAVFENKLAETY